MWQVLVLPASSTIMNSQQLLMLLAVSFHGDPFSCRLPGPAVSQLLHSSRIPVLNSNFCASADSQPVADDHPADLILGLQPCHRGVGARQCSTVNNAAVDSCLNDLEISLGDCNERCLLVAVISSQLMHRPLESEMLACCI